MVPYFTRLGLSRRPPQEGDRRSTAFVASHLDYQNAPGLVAAHSAIPSFARGASASGVRGESGGDVRIVHPRVKRVAPARLRIVLRICPAVGVGWR
jgi:hypothetical protein